MWGRDTCGKWVASTVCVDQEECTLLSECIVSDCRVRPFVASEQRAQAQSCVNTGNVLLKSDDHPKGINVAMLIVFQEGTCAVSQWTSSGIRGPS
jgi:hypothetical protein